MSAAAGLRPKVGRAFLKLGFGEAVARIVAFGATVYLARVLGASLYGVIVLASAVLLYLTYLTDLGVESLGIRDVADDAAELRGTLGATLGARLCVGLLLAAATVAVGLTVLPEPDGAILAAYAMVLLPIALGTKWIHLGLEQAGIASVGRMVTEVSAAVLVVALVRRPDGIGWVPVAQIFGEGVGAYLLLRLLPDGLGRLPAALRPGAIGPLLSRSWPIVGHSLLGLAIFNSDFLFLRGFRDSAAVGFYAAAYTLVSFFLNLGVAYGMTMLPVMTRVRHLHGEATALYHGAMAQVLSGALPIAIGGSLVAGGLIDLIFTPSYHPAALPLQILVWTVPVALVRNVSQAALLAHGRQDLMFRTVGWAAAINLSLNVVLIPIWGTVGAAIATLVTETIRTVLACRYSAALGLPMPTPARFSRIGLAALAMALAVWLSLGLPVTLSVLIGVASYGVALVATGILRIHRGALPEFAP